MYLNLNQKYLSGIKNTDNTTWFFRAFTDPLNKEIKKPKELSVAILVLEWVYIQ